MPSDAQGGAVLSVRRARAARKPQQPPTEECQQQENETSTKVDLQSIRRQLEWYFSDENLSTDQVLHHAISLALPLGWLSCDVLLSRASLRDLEATPQLVLQALQDSHLETITRRRSSIEPSGSIGEILVRRRQPLPPLLSPAALDLDEQGQPLLTDPQPLVLVDRHRTLKRLRDLWRVQRALQLSEVGDCATIFCEKPAGQQQRQVVLAVGYERVVYGDHGPYVEFSETQIQWDSWPHYFDKRKYNSYFDEYYTSNSHRLWQSRWESWAPNPSQGILLLYAQRHPVTDRPWAPGSGSSPDSVGRPGGYADYRPGYFYIAADESLISVEAQAPPAHGAKDVVQEA